jgi:hypothetical protein
MNKDEIQMVMVLIVATIAVAMIGVVVSELNECGAGQRAVTGVMNGHYVSLCIDK